MQLFSYHNRESTNKREPIEQTVFVRNAIVGNLRASSQACNFRVFSEFIHIKMFGKKQKIVPEPTSPELNIQSVGVPQTPW